MESKTVSSDMIVEDVLDQWPQTVTVFLTNRMACVGCPMARFTTIADAVDIYNLPLHIFLCELEKVIAIAEEDNEKSNNSKEA
jgi:hybrid cluster-associated redox disulfide protein